MQVWKYQLKEKVSVCEIPKNAKVLCVQLQHGKPCIWAQVDPDAKPETRMFQIHPTGQPMGSAVSKYIGTYQVGEEVGLSYVWHVFEVLRA